MIVILKQEELGLGRRGEKDFREIFARLSVREGNIENTPGKIILRMKYNRYTNVINGIYCSCRSSHADICYRCII